jgi:hypothetical protein
MEGVIRISFTYKSDKLATKHAVAVKEDDVFATRFHVREVL